MSKNSGRNPFRPGVGIHPPFLAGRAGPIGRFRAMLRGAPEQPANMRLTGLRGVGKTVLLHEFAREASASQWVAITEEVGAAHNSDDGIQRLARALTDKARLDISRIERVKKAVGKVITSRQLTVEWNEISFSVDSGKTGRGISKEFLELCSLAVDKGRAGVLLLLDEAQTLRDDKRRDGEHPLSLLIAAVVALQKQEVPIGLVLCGLPTLAGNLLKAKSYTERMFRGEVIGSLEAQDAQSALVEPLKDGPVSATKPLVKRVIAEVEGYPYFVQLWGAELWDAAFEGGTDTISERLLEATQPNIYHRLDNDFYEPRVSTLTPAEQDLLLLTATSKTYPPLLVHEVNDRSDKSPGNINVLLGRLVEAGVLYRLRKGQYDYTAPKFRQYLTRRIARMPV